MAQYHDKLLASYRFDLIKKGYTISKDNPFVDYRPDILAKKDNKHIFIEVEIEQTIDSDHTLGQLTKMYRYVKRNKHYEGNLVVPYQIKNQAILLIDSLFGDNKISVKTVK